MCPFADARAAITGSPTAMPASTASACFTVDAPESLITGSVPSRVSAGGKAPGKVQEAITLSAPGSTRSVTGSVPSSSPSPPYGISAVRLDPHLAAAQHLDLRPAYVRAVRQLAHRR